MKDMLPAGTLMLICFSAAQSSASVQRNEPGDVRLVRGGSRCAGVVEMFQTGEWKGVKGVKRGNMGTVVCRQLGCGHYSVLKLLPAKHYPSVLHADCEEVQSALRECQITEESNRDTDYVTEIMCSGSVRFAEGYKHCSGTVEVKTSQSWTTVCESDFDWQDAEVVCREVGCGPPLTVQRALFSKGVYPIGTKEFRCNGSEVRFLDCSTSDRGQQNCTDGSLVGVTCTEREDVRLVEGGSRCAGAVEVLYEGEWMRLRSHDWSHLVGTFLWAMDEAAVVCRQLGCGSPLAATWKNDSVPTIYVGCGGRETTLRQCTHFVDVFNASHCGVICSELLVHPSISFSTPIRPSRVLQGPQVFRGHSFTVTCFTEPQYPGGSFHLRVPWTNRTLVQAAVHHSASFAFHTTDDSHQGSYSCVYENQVLFRRYGFWLKDRRLSGSFSHNFSSESTIFYITITDSPLPAAITRIVLLPILMLITNLFIFWIFRKCGASLIGSSSAVLLMMSGMFTG